MKVNTLGMIFAAQRLETAAGRLEALKAAVLAPLAADGTSLGASGRLDAASTALLTSTAAQAASLHSAAMHLMLIAAKFATQEEINKANLSYLNMQASAIDDGTLSTLDPVPPLLPDVRLPLAPSAPVAGEVFSQQIHNGSATRAVDFTTTANNNGSQLDDVAATVREVAAAVPDYWDSPVGTDALAGRLNEYVTNLNAVADRWFELGGQARKHGDDYSETVSATPKPQEFTDARDRLNRALAAKDPVAASQASTDLGMLNGRATAEASRYAGVTEATTGLGAPSAPGLPAGVPAAAAAAAGAGAAAPAQAAGAAGQTQQVAKTGATEAAAQAGQTGQGADQLAQMLPQALQSIGGMAGGLAGMAGQVPQQLMQAGQGLAQTAQQGLGGLMGKNATDAELAKKAGDLESGELSREGLGGGGAGGGGGGVGDTHPAGALGPPVTPTASHTAPNMPSGAPAPPLTTATASGGSAMGGMPMGMPMSGMMGHGQGGGDGPDKVAADKKVVTPPQPHTEAVTGRVPDRTFAAAEAARNRADSDAESDDDPPPHGPIVRRITLAPLNDERS